MEKNLVRCRAEAEGVLHVRDIQQGAYAIA
jgi:hypothetical protein